jgi:ectoine hydroxylase-related dioxygenase (phytanoyl-CoA dioxygenase family)
MKKVNFKNNDLEASFSKNGYALIKGFLSLKTVEEIRKIYYKYHVEKVDGLMWNSLYHVSVPESKSISERLLELIKPELDKLFISYNAPMATLMSKCALMPEGLDTPHRDYSVLNEDEFEYRQIWIPIVDINENNGPMLVVPGSHQYSHEILPMMAKCKYRQKVEELSKDYSEPIFMEAGDLLVYADRTIHAGLPNKTVHERPVVHFGIIPPEAPLYFYKNNKEGKIEKYSIPNEWYLNVRQFDYLPNEGEKLVEVI